MSELSVLGTMLFRGPTTRASCRCREESSSRRHCIYPMTRPMSLTALCVQSFPFALLESLNLGIDSGVEKRRKIPVKTKTMQIVNAFRAGSCKRIRLLIIWPNHFSNRPFTPFLWLFSPACVAKRVQIPSKPLNSRFCSAQ